MTLGPYREVLGRARIWDYDPANRESTSWPVCRIGYHSALQRIAFQNERPIDVLFYGSLNLRRQALCDVLRGRGLNVVARFGLYGKERDDLLAATKVVLNAHYYPQSIFEQVRVQYPIANKIAVVSEVGKSEHIEAEYAPIVTFAPYDELANACEALVHGSWKEKGEEGFTTYSSGMLQADFLTALSRQLEQSDVS